MNNGLARLADCSIFYGNEHACMDSRVLAYGDRASLIIGYMSLFGRNW